MTIKTRKSAVRRPRASTADLLSLLQWLGIAQPSSWRFLLLMSVVLVSGISVVRMTHEHRSLFNELQQLRGQANQAQVEWGQLLIEQSTFGLEGKIEQKAAADLRMTLPAVDSIVMVSNEN